jgi:chromosomal replication initiator protein
MEPRHVAIWLSRALTENTLADIGEHFGGRSHGTVKHSIKWVEDMQVGNRDFASRLVRMREGILEQ